jgi:hypothetical protein
MTYLYVCYVDFDLDFDLDLDVLELDRFSVTV